MEIAAITFIALGILVIIALFVRDRAKQGIRPLQVTDKDKAQLQEFCAEFAPRRLAGQLIGTLGALIVVAAFYGVVSSDSSTPKWRTLFFMLITGVALVVAGGLLVKPPRHRPRYWRTAVSGVVCSACSLLFFVCVVIVVRTPKDHIPRWLWGVIGLLIVVGTFAAIVCIHSGIVDVLSVRLGKSEEGKEPVTKLDRNA